MTMGPRAATTPAKDAETLVIRDAETMKALAEPTRMQILLELAEEAKTVKEVAETLGVGPTRLYYHFKILERARLIRVAGRRMVSGIQERRYVATAKSWTPAPELMPSLVETGIVSAMLGLVEAELDLALDAQSTTPLGEPGSPVPVMSLTRLALSEKEVADVQRRVESIMEDYGTTARAPKGKRIYGMLFTGYQVPTELAITSRKEQS
jgi:DNA-binding transcriptional ArsR family regulator